MCGIGNINISENVTTERIDNTNLSLYSIIKARFECSDECIYISDTFYNRISNDEINAFLEEDDTNLVLFRPDISDCDDYALHLMSAARSHFAEENKNAAFGMIWVDYHAVNFYVNMTYDINIFDPQTEEEYIPEEYVHFVYI